MSIAATFQELVMHASRGRVRCHEEPWGDLVFTGDKPNRWYRLNRHRLEGISRANLGEECERLYSLIAATLFGVPLVPLPRRASGLVRIRLAERAREERKKRDV